MTSKTSGKPQRRGGRENIKQSEDMDLGNKKVQANKKTKSMTGLKKNTS